MTSTNNGTELA